MQKLEKKLMVYRIFVCILWANSLTLIIQNSWQCSHISQSQAQRAPPPNLVAKDKQNIKATTQLRIAVVGVS